jgi:hypothetical protein
MFFHVPSINRLDSAGFAGHLVLLLVGRSFQESSRDAGLLLSAYFRPLASADFAVVVID